MEPLRTRKRRAMALVGIMMALFTIMAVLLVGTLAGQTRTHRGGLTSTTDGALRLAALRGQSVTAFNLAESGVEYTLQWLHMQSTPPGTTALSPALWGGNPFTVRDAGGTAVGSFRVLIYPDALNPGRTLKRYLIESVGTSGRFSQTVRAWVQQASFGKYAYFTDNHRSGVAFISNLTSFDGPAHCNNTDGTLNYIIWSNAANTRPIFKDTFTCSAPAINWSLNGTSTAPQTEADWLKVSTLGSAGVKTGQPKIPLPTSSSLQRDAALPPGTTAPTSTGVLVPNNGSATTGGIYIHGPVEQMRLSVDGAGNQVIAIEQDPDSKKEALLVTTITLNRQTGRTRISAVTSDKRGNSLKSTASEYTGLTNGVVYSNDDIGSQGSSSGPGQGLSGVIADDTALTIATGSSNTVHLNGNLTLQTPRRKDADGNYLPLDQDPAFATRAGRLGIVSNRVRIVETDAAGTAITNIETNAAVMAYDTFDVVNFSTRPPGGSVLLGSYIAGMQGSFGVSSGGVIRNGLAPTRNYDPRLSDNPPPFFPTTSSQYDILSWQRVRAPLS